MKCRSFFRFGLLPAMCYARVGEKNKKVVQNRQPSPIHKILSLVTNKKQFNDIQTCRNSNFGNLPCF